MNSGVQFLALGMVFGALSPTAMAAAPATGDAATAVVTTVERICLPLIEGQPIKTVAAATGLKQARGEWVLQLEGKQRVTVAPPGGANPTVCSAVIIHAPGDQEPIVKALDAWAMGKTPAYSRDKVREDIKGAVALRKTSSWYAATPAGNTNIVFSEEKTLQGGPVAGPLDQATLMVNVAKP